MKQDRIRRGDLRETGTVWKCRHGPAGVNWRDRADSGFGRRSAGPCARNVVAGVAEKVEHDRCESAAAGGWHAADWAVRLIGREICLHWAELFGPCGGVRNESSG